MFADDTLGYVSSQQDVTCLMKDIHLYSRATASKLNLSKCNFLLLRGDISVPGIRTLDNNLIEILLEIPIAKQHDYTFYWENLIKKIKAKISQYSSKNSSLFGRALIAKSLLTPHLYYLANLYQLPPSWRKLFTQ